MRRADPNSPKSSDPVLPQKSLSDRFAAWIKRSPESPRRCLVCLGACPRCKARRIAAS